MLTISTLQGFTSIITTTLFGSNFGFPGFPTPTTYVLANTPQGVAPSGNSALAPAGNSNMAQNHPTITVPGLPPTTYTTSTDPPGTYGPGTYVIVGSPYPTITVPGAPAGPVTEYTDP